MTIRESTVCGLLQSFPILLILAQNHHKCLKTPLIYKPPTPTPSPEYYEALEALLQTLYSDNQHHNHHHGCYGDYEYGKKYPQHHTPCYTYAYPSTSGHGHQTGYSYPGYVYQGVGYPYKKVNIYNLTSGVHGYKGYAPNQVYKINQKIKIVYKKNRRRPQKLQGLFPNQREDRRYPNTQGFSQNLVSYPKKISERLTGILHLQPNGNSQYIYPFNNRPISNTVSYDQYGRPIPAYQNYPYGYAEYPYRDPYSRPVQFPNAVQYGEASNYQNYDGNNGEETCQTVEGGYGTCLSILSCGPYVELLTNARSNNPDVVHLLRRAHCGFEGANPKVCCPRQGFPTELPTAPPPPPTPAPTEAPRPDPNPKTDPNYQHGATFLQPPVCGLSNASLGRVVGGVDARLGDFPWMALLGYKNRQGTGWNCGGSLISAKHILTAAHCIYGHEQSLYVVRLGELDTMRDDDGATPVDILIAKKIMHEKYNRTAYTDDIALLVLQRTVAFTALIRPICIPYPSELRSNSFENYNPLIAGWGAIEFRGASASHLQVLQLPVVSNDFCKQAYVNYKAQKIDERVLCAGYKRGGKDACQGDSGGPLMQPIYNSETQTAYFFQIGVVSFGKKCAEPGFPGVYTRITHFVPWIEKTMLTNP